MSHNKERAGGGSSSIGALEQAIAALEAALDPLFVERRYREFFQRAQQVRSAIRGARLAPRERTLLWDRLNRCTESAKERQEREFAERNAANLARWREQRLRAEDYAAALSREIAELAGRGGPPAELERWQRRIAEKQARLASVRATIADLERKIGEVSRRNAGRATGT